MVQELNRSEVDPKLTWNVSDIFKDDIEFKQAIGGLRKEIEQLSTASKNLQPTAQQVLTINSLLYQSEEHLLRIYGYAARINDGDTSDPHGNDLYNQAIRVMNDWETAVAFFEPWIISFSTTQMAQFYTEEPNLQKYQFNLEKIQAQAAHTLSQSAEELLAKLQPTIDAPAEISTKLDDADLDFGTILDEQGQKVQLTNAKAAEFGTSSDPELRKRSAKAVATAYTQMRNTFASTLSNHVHAQNTLAQLRHFDSARQMNLAAQKIPEAVYDNLIEVNHQHLDLLHRYYRLRKQVLKLDHMYEYDRHVALLPEAKLDLTYKEGQQVTMVALGKLGSDYQAHLQTEFNNRWIDVVENKGKRSGGYEDDVYGVHPYILLNWSDIYDSTSTLAHESGHAMQSVYTDLAQPFWYSQYPIFIAEIASTLNESLLNDYMLKKYQGDSKIQSFILTQDIDNFIGTVYRQTIFAEFEHFIYQTDAQGVALTPDLLADKFNGLFSEYNGSAVDKLPWKADTWAQIPHFYYNYYVYQYATSKAIAVSLAQDIIAERPQAVEKYLTFLSAGASDYPVEIVKKAGIDVTKTDYLEQAFAVFESEVNQLEKILGKR